MYQSNTVISEREKDLELNKEFVPEGIKYHQLVDISSIIITEAETGDIYLTSYFVIDPLWKSYLNVDRYRQAKSNLLSSKVVIIDYDTRKIYLKKIKFPTGAKLIQEDFNRVISEGLSLEDMNEYINFMES